MVLRLAAASRSGPASPFIAVDPRQADRARFLIGGRWKLKKGLEATLPAELQDVLKLPPARPGAPSPG